MKLNKENYELLMFDLLEGNLNEADELSVMRQIEEDEFFFNEWKLLKSSILVAEKEVVFTGKQSLLKEDKVVTILPMRRVWMSVAASICLIGAVFILWPKGSTTTELVNSPIESNENTAEQDSETESNQSAIASSDELQEKNYSPEVKIIHQVNRKTPSTEAEVIETPDIQQDSPQLPSLDDEPVHQPVVKPKFIAKEEVAPTEQDHKNNSVNVDDSLKAHIPEIIAQNDKVKAPEQLKLTEIAKDFVTKNKPSRIKQKANEIIALVSNPKVRFRPDFKSKRPSLEIELETEGYVAIASLQPFKNRNN